MDSVRHAPDAREYLSVRLGTRHYGIDILRVREIRDCETPTRIASAPAFMLGVINLRGLIVPLVDLRLCLGDAEPGPDEAASVVVLGLDGRTVGIVVDGVDDVLQLVPAQVQPAPEVGLGLDADTVTGLATVGERMVILLDIETLMLGAGMGLVDA